MAGYYNYYGHGYVTYPVPWSVQLNSSHQQYSYPTRQQSNVRTESSDKPRNLSYLLQRASQPVYIPRRSTPPSRNGMSDLMLRACQPLPKQPWIPSVQPTARITMRTTHSLAHHTTTTAQSVHPAQSTYPAAADPSPAAADPPPAAADPSPAAADPSIPAATDSSIPAAADPSIPAAADPSIPAAADLSIPAAADLLIPAADVRDSTPTQVPPPPIHAEVQSPSECPSLPIHHVTPPPEPATDINAAVCQPPEPTSPPVQDETTLVDATEDSPAYTEPLVIYSNTPLHTRKLEDSDECPSDKVDSSRSADDADSGIVDNGSRLRAYLKVAEYENSLLDSDHGSCSSTNSLAHRAGISRARLERVIRRVDGWLEDVFHAAAVTYATTSTSNRLMIPFSEQILRNQVMMTRSMAKRASAHVGFCELPAPKRKRRKTTTE